MRFFALLILLTGFSALNASAQAFAAPCPANSPSVTVDSCTALLTQLKQTQFEAKKQYPCSTQRSGLFTRQ